jgi:hypothetical protein
MHLTSIAFSLISFFTVFGQSVQQEGYLPNYRILPTNDGQNRTTFPYLAYDGALDFVAICGGSLKNFLYDNPNAGYTAGNEDAKELKC